MTDVTIQEDGIRKVRENIRLDIGNEDLTTGQPVHFDAKEVTYGVLCIFFLERLLSKDCSQIGPLRISCSHLEIGIKDGCSDANHCRSWMQLFFSEDSIIGEFFSAERLRKLDSDLR